MEELSAGGLPVGTTLIVHGEVEARSADNALRPLQSGSPIFLYDRIVTGDDGTITILFADGGHTRLDLGPGADVLLDNDVLPDSPADLSEHAATVEGIQEALLAAAFDPAGAPAVSATGQAIGLIIDDAEDISVREFDDTATSHTGDHVSDHSSDHAGTTGTGSDILVGNFDDDIIYGEEGSGPFGNEAEDPADGAHGDNLQNGDQIDYLPTYPRLAGNELPPIEDDGAASNKVGDGPADAGHDGTIAAGNSAPDIDIDTLLATPDDEI